MSLTKKFESGIIIWNKVQLVVDVYRIIRNGLFFFWCNRTYFIQKDAHKVLRALCAQTFIIEMRREVFS